MKPKIIIVVDWGSQSFNGNLNKMSQRGSVTLN